MEGLFTTSTPPSSVGLKLDGLIDAEYTPVEVANSHGCLGAAEALLKAGAKPNDSVFRQALRNGRMAKVLIENGADDNVGLKMDGNALHYAAVKAVVLDNLTCLKLFLEAGAKERFVEVKK